MNNVDKNIDLPKSEKRILEFWKKNDVFQKGLSLRRDGVRWNFYEGPPTANGRPHPGHVLTRAIKDLFLRYKSMCGYYVPRKAGWDTHGLPVEIEVEKELKLDGKTEVEKYGVEPFVRKCMDSVFRYTTDWENLTNRIGFWIDLPEAYVTYHKSYVESVWWSLKELHSLNLLYRGHKILPWCPHCQTALSSNEVAQGYRTIDSASLYVGFLDAQDQDVKYLAWTTTPWTLSSNVALAINKDEEYSYVRDGVKILVLASRLVKDVFKFEVEIIKTVSGHDLIGRSYIHPFDQAVRGKILHADFVSITSGSGIVHIAPAYGADDYALAIKNNLPIVQDVGPDGVFAVRGRVFDGLSIEDAQSVIITLLKASGSLFERRQVKHEYPFCWRCENPLIYFARGGWFIKTTEEIKKITYNNMKTQWHPSHIQDGRFGSFLEGNVDWALSRERYWGTPLPIWVCHKCGNEEAISSFDDLKNKSGIEGLDVFDKAKIKDPSLNEHLRIHKPWIDKAIFSCTCGGRMIRTSEVIDCWYDSGAMPFAQWGYPHVAGSKEQFNQAFPADFISEAIDQTRGWFYSLMAESTLLAESFKKTSGTYAPYPHPYKTCLVLGHVCDEHGKKLAKSNPEHRSEKYNVSTILDEQGADALRWFFYVSNPAWNNSRFSKSAVQDVQKDFILKLRNVYSFFTIYALIDKFDPEDMEKASWCFYSGLDNWLKSESHILVKTVRSKLDEFDPYGAARAISEFVDSVSNWYVRRSRRRFWESWEKPDFSGTRDRDKLAAYWTLYECLLTIAKVSAPFIPFLAEEIWLNLRHKNAPESVHLCDYPLPSDAEIKPVLSNSIRLVREIASLGHAARTSAKIKTRQPLTKAIIVASDLAYVRDIQKNYGLLLEELNVKSIEFSGLTDGFVLPRMKPNFKSIGAKFRNRAQDVADAIRTEDHAAIHQRMLAADGKFMVQADDGEPFYLDPEDVLITLVPKDGFVSAGSNPVVLLETKLTSELLDEGMVRELISRINFWRGENDFSYDRRIAMSMKASLKLRTVIEKFNEYICAETMASRLLVGEDLSPSASLKMALEIGDEMVVIAILQSEP